MQRRSASTVVAILAMLFAVTACAPAAGGHELRVMVPNSPGGGYDVTARTAFKISETAGITDAVPVFNLVGAGGTLALQRLMHETGNPELLMMMGLGVIGATITSGSPTRVTDATPIARLIEEPEGIMVRSDSPYRTIDELTNAWRADPDAFIVGGGSQAGGPDHLMSMKLAEAVGVTARRVNYMAYDGGGQLLPALLDGSIDFATSGVREYRQQIESGQLRALAVSGESRMPDLDVPTLAETGIDVVFSNWRGVIAPPDITEAEKQSLVNIFVELDKSAEWQAELTRNGWTDALITGGEFTAFLDEQDKSVTASLEELGLG